jgi:hypothetical protein
MAVTDRYSFVEPEFGKLLSHQRCRCAANELPTHPALDGHQSLPDCAGPLGPAFRLRLKRRSRRRHCAFARGARDIVSSDEDGWARLIFYTPSQIPRNYARAGFDIPQNLQGAAMYQLPFGQGKKYFNAGVPKWIFGEWEWNSVFSAHSGEPFTVTASATSLNAPDNTQHADQVKPRVKKILGSGNGELYCDPTAFASVAAARFRTSGRDSSYALPWVDLDTSIFRNFPIKERLQLQPRAEAFSSTNSPHFNGPNSDVSGAGFMTTAAPQQDQRNPRFGARLD